MGPGRQFIPVAGFTNRRISQLGLTLPLATDVFLTGEPNFLIGDHTSIASQVLIYNSEHDINDEWFGAIEQPVVIGDYVFIGPRVVILPGVNIGDGAVIAAGAVVSKDIPKGEVSGGVPARKITDRQLHDYHYRLGRHRLFQ